MRDGPGRARFAQDAARVAACFARCRCCLPSWRSRLADGAARPAGTLRPRGRGRRKARPTQAPLAVTHRQPHPVDDPAQRPGPGQRHGHQRRRPDLDGDQRSTRSSSSDAPMTTAAPSCAAAADADDESVGERITDPGAVLHDRRARARRDRAVLRPRAAHRRSSVDGPASTGSACTPSGSSDDGRRPGADGRARTFLPLVPTDTTAVDTALVLPIRHEVAARRRRQRRDVGVLDARALSPGGQLRSLVDFGVAAGSRPITWLVDPAVTDAVAGAGRRQPAALARPTLSDDPDGSDDRVDPPSAGAPSASPGDEASPEDDEPEDPGTQPRRRRGRRRGSTGCTTGSRATRSWRLPYGDVDVSGAADHDPAVYRARASVRSGTELAPWGLPVSPAVASPTGYLDPAGIRDDRARHPRPRHRPDVPRRAPAGGRQHRRPHPGGHLLGCGQRRSGSRRRRCRRSPCVSGSSARPRCETLTHGPQAAGRRAPLDLAPGLGRPASSTGSTSTGCT